MPLISYKCSKCSHSFQLMRPQARVDEAQPCPKCGHDALSTASYQGAAQPGPRQGDPPPAGLHELPSWVRGQVEAQVRQLVGSGDAVAGQEVDLVTQAVLGELSNTAPGAITPTAIRLLAQRHLSGLDSWANTARRRNAQLDAAEKLDED